MHILFIKFIGSAPLALYKCKMFEYIQTFYTIIMIDKRKKGIRF